MSENAQFRVPQIATRTPEADIPRQKNAVNKVRGRVDNTMGDSDKQPRQGRIGRKG